MTMKPSMRRRAVVSAAVLSLCLTSFAAFDFGTVFSDEKSWIVSAENFTVEHSGCGFEFASDKRETVNCLKHDTCTWHGMKVWESKIYFDKDAEEEHVKRIELSLYNRGDAERDERIDVPELKKLIAAAGEKLAPGEKPPRPLRTKFRNSTFQYRQRFPGCRAELAWGLSAPDSDNRRAVEYLRLTLGSPVAGKAQSRRRGASSAGKSQKKSIKSNVTKGPGGDVYIDGVPMVDQGDKGYCSAAVSERVLRYYGHNIDEHEIAQLAGTTAEGGTSVRAMKEAIIAIGEKNSLGFQNIVSMSSGAQSLREEIEMYNKAAKIEKKSGLSLDDFIRNNVIYVCEMRKAMDKKVIYRMRCRDPRYKRFLSGVYRQIDAGIPVFWGVTFGIFPERGVSPRSTGGHMRLIIGYNEKKKEILYTDSWGDGHELKRMPEDWAFAITDDAFFLKPRR